MGLQIEEGLIQLVFVNVGEGGNGKVRNEQFPNAFVSLLSRHMLPQLRLQSWL